jgi:hypothetical protein
VRHFVIPLGVFHLCFTRISSAPKWRLAYFQPHVSDAARRNGAVYGKARERSEREAHGKVVSLAVPSKTASASLEQSTIGSKEKGLTDGRTWLAAENGHFKSKREKK